MAIVSTGLKGSVLILTVLLTKNSMALGCTDMKTASQNDSDDTCYNHIQSFCSGHSSCASACGQAVEKRDHFATRICSCDFLCLLYDDCCFDFKTQCPTEYDKLNQSPLKRLTNIKSKCIGQYMTLSSCADGHLETSNKQVTNCTTSKHSVTVDGDKLKVNSSDIMTSSITNTEDCDQDTDAVPYDKIPVTDIQTGLTYSDKDHYLCNNPGSSTDSFQKWNKKYISGQPFVFKELEDFLSKGKSSERFLKALSDAPPESIVPRYCPPEMTVQCNFNCKYNTNKKTQNFHRIICNELYQLYQGRETECEPPLPLKQVFESRGLVKTKRFKLPMSENDNECDFGQHYNTHSNTMFGASPFSALLSLDDSTKRVIRGPRSPSFPGGWDEFICETDDNGSGCQMKFACNHQNVYFNKGCMKPRAILIIIKSTNQDLGHENTWDVWHTFMKSLRNHKTLQYDNDQYNDVYKTNESLINVYITIPKLVGVLERKDKYSRNQYRDIIGSMFTNIVESVEWNGTVSTCYYARFMLLPFKDLLYQFAQLKADRLLFCEDIAPARNWSKQINGHQEGNKADAQTMILSDFIRLCFAICIVVYVVKNVGLGQ